MSNIKKNLTHGLSSQEDLFGSPEPTPGSFNLSSEVPSMISRVIKQSHKSRPQIVLEMTELLFGEDPDRMITIPMLDAWTSTAKEGHRFPLEYLPAFCHVTGDYSLMVRLGELCGCSVLMAAEAVYVRIAKLEKRRADLEREEANLRRYLGGLEKH